MEPDTEEIQEQKQLPEPVSSSGSIQAAAPRFHFSLKQFEKKLGWVSSIIFKVSLVMVLLFTFILIFTELTDSRYSIQQINVPVRFAEAGYTDEVIANRITDKLFEIIHRQRFQEEALQYSNAFDESDLTVEVAGTGVQLRQMIGFMGKKLGISSNKAIRADISMDRDTIIFVLKVKDHPSEKFRIPSQGSLEHAVNIISAKASETILKYTSPYLLARYYLYVDSQGNSNLAKFLFENYRGDEKMERVAYFSHAAAYLANANYTLAEKVINEGLAKYPHDINLNAAYGTILEEQRRCVESLRQHRKTFQMITSETPLLRKTLCLNNLGNVYRCLGDYDSSVYCFHRALQIDPDAPFAYLNLARTHLLLKQDTTKFLEAVEPALRRGMKRYLIRDSAIMKIKKLQALVQLYDE